MSNTINYSLAAIDCRSTYYSAAYTAQCEGGYEGDSVYVGEGAFVSRDSQIDADTLAQAYAESQLVCTPPAFGNFLDSARQATPSPELFTLPNGINEFDILFEEGEYHLFYTCVLDTKHRRAASVALLATASDDVTVAGRFPTALLSGGVWNLWTWDSVASRTKHFTSASASGPYIDSGEILPLQLLDWHVRPLSSGGFISSYKHLTVRKIGILTATSVSGPWTDKGYMLSNIDTPSWTASEEADASTFEYGGKLYCPFSSFDGVIQRVSIVEVNSTTFRAVNQPVSIQSPTEPWMRTGGSNKIFNPVFLTDRIFFAHNTSSTTAAGWAELVMPEHPVVDGRTNSHATLLDSGNSTDLATGIPIALHGTASVSASGVSVQSSVGGAYGFLNYTSITDFTMFVRFTPNSITGAYQLIFRATGYNPEVNPVIGVWVDPLGKVHVEVHDSAALGVLNLNVGSVIVGGSNSLTVQKVAGSVEVVLNGSVVGSGAHSATISNLAEWSILNKMGRSSASNQQMLGVVHEAYLTLQ